jgi:anthraniloyl-CoA monooxygenase
MTCVSPDARITPSCPGMWSPDHTEAWTRIVEFVHANTTAKIAMQLGHAGPKGSTKVMWEGVDQPLPAGNWPLIAASPEQYLDGVSQVAREATREDMDRVLEDFVRATRQSEEAGFDWLELHCAHGYLLSAFITPLTNRRTDEYGGALENRLRFPLEVLAAVRAVWPEGKPISVRISAHDWMGDAAVTPAEAVEISRLLAAGGADLIDVSAGQTSIDARPVYGRMFQAPFSDRIRNEARLATMAVGNIYEPDHVNSILMAGRADLVCLARPHLADPYWTLHAAARLGYDGVEWPKPYFRGRDQLRRLASRGEGTTMRV